MEANLEGFVFSFVLIVALGTVVGCASIDVLVIKPAAERIRTGTRAITRTRTKEFFIEFSVMVANGIADGNIAMAS